MDKYVIKKELGSGAFGQTYLVEQNGKKYVMKQIALTASNVADVQTEVDALYKVSIVNNCNDKSMSVLCLHDYFVHYKDSKPYFIIVMNYLENAITLRQYMNDNIHTEKEDILFFISRLVDQLNILHNHNIIHGDIKPENVIVQIKNNSIINVMLIDFGLSCLKKCIPGGTITYAAPEILPIIGTNSEIKRAESPQWRRYVPVNKNDYKKTDVWSLGLVFYELIMRELPFAIENVAAPTLLYKLVKFYQNLDEIIVDNDFDEHVLHIVQKMLRTNPFKRISIHRVKSALNKFFVDNVLVKFPKRAQVSNGL